MHISKSIEEKVEQEYLAFLGDLYISSEELTKDATTWLLSELAFTISIVHPDYRKSKVVDLLINLQKLKRIGNKKIEIWYGS